MEIISTNNPTFFIFFLIRDRWLSKDFVSIFTSRSKLTKSRIKRNWDRKDWWIDADECLELGLVDEVRAMLPEHQDNNKPPKKRNTKK